MKAKKIIAGFASFLYLITGCNAMNKNATEFDWYATESAPDHYPMEIIRGTFIYKGKSDGLYIPSGGTLNNGWGTSISMHVVGPDKKPLPDRLDINFYSYAEKQFYRGSFDLPYEEILALFRQANIDRPGKPYYSSIMVGVTPGGTVSVWVNGAFTKEVFFGQAEKYDMLPFPTFGLPFKTKEESDAYIEKQLVNVLTPEELESLKKNGIPFGTWARARKLYTWIPVYTKGKESTDKEMFVDYINGEKNKMPTRLKEDEFIPRALPKDLQFSSKVNGESFFYIIHFDEYELMNAFEKLGEHGEKVYIEFDPQLPRPNTKIRIHNDKESIELRKMITEDW
jgi:hypothetical protein